MTESLARLRRIAPLGHPILRTTAGPADLPATDVARGLIADMLATLEDANGVGIRPASDRAASSPTGEG